MKELTSIFWVLVLLIAGVLLYKTVPAYWENFNVNRMISDQAIYYTTYPKSDQVIEADISQKAGDLGVPLTPDEVTVVRTPGDLSINVAYSVHIDMPIYPFDLNFKDSTTNHNIMK